MKTKSFKNKIDKYVPEGVRKGVVALLFGIVLGTIFISIAGFNPIQVFYLIGTSWTKSSFMVGDLLSILSFYLIAACASIVATKAGLFNIGIGGQMMMGGIAAYMIAINTTMPKGASILTSLLVASLVGMLMAIVVVLLKIYFNIHEVLSSIMLNWISFYGYKWLFNSSEKSWVSSNLEGITIGSEDSLRVEWLSNLFPNSQISLGIFIALFVVIFVYILLKFTVFGKKLKLVGLNQSASNYSGIKVKSTLIKAMGLSGILAGISGVVFFMGVNQNIPLYKDGLPGEYFNAIAVAMLGGNHPLGSIISGFIFAMIYSSQNTLAIIGISFEVSQLLISVIMYSIALAAITQHYHPIKLVKTKINERKEKNEFITNYIDNKKVNSEV